MLFPSAQTAIGIKFFRNSLVIFIGIDDTDIIGTPGTNQLARVILKRIGDTARDSVICRHQLFFDPRVPYTSKNGSASIQLPHATEKDIKPLLQTIRDVMLQWFVDGSDPGLCVATGASEEMTAFSFRCKSEVVTQDEARAIATRSGCYLEGLGGTEQGVIGALAAVGLIVGGEDGRVVHLSSWPYPDSFSGPQTIEDLYARGISRIQQVESGEPVTLGPIDIGKHLRPNWRGGGIVLYVDASTERGTAPWRALKLL
jgi:hypothetical protein